ncbi:cellulase family glycosylhydrolase [Actinophytocola sp.]|uniref:glycoside hydrolase 5 family protein n=1 Tax=Actinophytocola sp. TaxID=1872138 RepID=UPI0025BE5748|nr:cellulase family glycosylhydrolase [Actinophytocola sp.]
MLLIDGRPWLGANFWSRVGGPLMWRRYDPDVIHQELRVLREHGLNLTRSFFYWPDFHPEPDRVDEELCARFADFLDQHVEAGMRTIPTFIVGHMSGENWDPSWRAGRDLYGDVWLVARQAWFVKEMTRRFHAHPAIAAWLLSNEMPIYGEPAPAERVTPWAQLMIDAVRAGGGTQPVSVGDGAWGIEITGVDNGFSVRDLAGLTDFVGPHVYRMENDVVRQHLTAAFICALAATMGKPVVLEEFGVTDNFTSQEHAAHYYRQILHNTLLAGSTGWIAWNNTDYDDLFDQDPYRHHAFEMHFGLTDARGTPKPQLVAVREFAEVLSHVDFPACVRPAPEAALVVPSYLERAYPFTVPSDRTFVFDVLRQAYVATREADLQVEPAREADGLPEDRKLYLVPSAKQLTAPAWRDLARFAEEGATIYVSYSPGGNAVQRGPWHADVNGMFGIEHQLRYGLLDPIEDDEVTVRFLRDLGPILEGTELRFPTGGGENAYLPVRPAGAEVVAVDRHGRPALLGRRVGSGRIVLCTYPIEALAAATPRVNPEPSHRIYAALADLAGVVRPVTVADPLVHAATLSHEDGRRFVWLVSQSPADRTVRPVAAGKLTELESEQPVDEVTLPAFGVRVLQLTLES